MALLRVSPTGDFEVALWWNKEAQLLSLRRQTANLHIICICLSSLCKGNDSARRDPEVQDAEEAHTSMIVKIPSWRVSVLDLLIICLWVKQMFILFKNNKLASWRKNWCWSII